MYATVVLYWYLPDPHKGHLSNIHNLYVYPKKYTSTSIKLNLDIDMLSYENFKTIEGKWSNLYAGKPE